MVEDRAMTVREHYDLDVQRDPSRVLETASKAAKALQSVIEGKANKVVINGETYLEFEDWQTLAQFYGYTVRTLDAEPVEVNGVQGAKAKAELVDFRTGEVVGGAVAYCMADEDRWAGKPWFQLSSMAQTRAGAKAFRNRLAWIVVLAGYRATPAEEMTGEEKPREQAHWCPVHNTAFRKFTKGNESWYSHKLSEGGYCNESKVAPKAETQKPEPAKPTIPVNNKVVEVKDIPPFPSTTEFLKWCNKTWNLQPADVWKETKTFCTIGSAGDIASLDQLTWLAENMVNLRKGPPAEEATDGLFEEVGE